MNIDCALLEKNPLFACMNESEIRSALTLMDGDTGIYSKGDILLLGGNELKKFGIVLYGNVTVCTDDIDGNRMIMNHVEKGSSFGESLSFLKIPSPSVTIFAASDTAVLWLSPRAFADPDTDEKKRLLQNFTSLLARRALKMNDRIQVLSKLKLRDKLITYFTFLAEKEKSRRFALPLSREGLAAYVGADRASLSREMSRMAKDGLIRLEKNCVTLL